MSQFIAQLSEHRLITVKVYYDSTQILSTYHSINGDFMVSRVQSSRSS